MVALPNPLDSHIVTCAEVLLQDAAAWVAALPAGASPQLSLEEVQAILLAAWETATGLLPVVVTRDPDQVPWAGASAVDLRLSA